VQLGRHSGIPARLVNSLPGWAGALLTRLGRLVLLSAGPASSQPRRWAVKSFCPGWASRLASLRLGRPARPCPGGPAPPQHLAGPDQEDPAWSGFISGPPSSPRPAVPDQEDPAWPGFLPLGRHLSNVSAGPGRDYPGPGRINPLQADLALSGPRLASSGTYSSSAMNSSALCQSWDALWLRLAHPPSLYAGLRMPLGSDQHTLHLLVSLILRRRIRLMTWRSRDNS
jgi:hypothetical protein